MAFAFVRRSDPNAESAPGRRGPTPDVIDQGQAALLVVGESKLEEAVEKRLQKAEKHIAKELDVSPKDLDAAIQQAAREVG